MVEVSADIGAASNVAQSSSFSNLNTFQSGKCRFCSNKLSADENLLGICSHTDCIQLASEACNKILSCGHFCGGIKDEEHCLPCFTCEKSGKFLLLHKTLSYKRPKSHTKRATVHCFTFSSVVLTSFRLLPRCFPTLTETICLRAWSFNLVWSNG